MQVLGKQGNQGAHFRFSDELQDPLVLDFVVLHGAHSSSSGPHLTLSTGGPGRSFELACGVSLFGWNIAAVTLKLMQSQQEGVKWEGEVAVDHDFLGIHNPSLKLELSKGPRDHHYQVHLEGLEGLLPERLLRDVRPMRGRVPQPLRQTWAVLPAEHPDTAVCLLHVSDTLWLRAMGLG